MKLKLTTNGGDIKDDWSRFTTNQEVTDPSQYRPQSPYKVHYTLTGASYPEGKNDRHKFNF